jgi:hypothetical protein
LSYAEDLQLLAEFGRAALAARDGMVRDALDAVDADELEGALRRYKRPRGADRAVRPAAGEYGAWLACDGERRSHAMMMRFTLTLAREAGDGSSAAMTRSVAIERDMLAPETLGFTLAEAKVILAELQAAIVADQVAAHEREERCCGSCGAARRVKGHRPLTCRTVFGTVQVEALRLRRCGCGEDSVAGDRASFSPVADLLPERTTPELLYFETRWGSLVSYGLAARMLGDVPPLGKPVAPERVRRHLHAVAVREEAILGDEADGAMWSGCQRDLHELPLPGGPAYVGVDGGFVRDRAGSWFEVIAGKSIPGFCRHAPEDEEPRPARCFACVQAHDDRPRRRFLDVLASQGTRRTSGSC